MKNQLATLSKFNIFVWLFLFVVASCGTDNNKLSESETDSLRKTNSQETSGYDKKGHKSVFYTKYKLPLPVELYLALKDERVPYNKNILCTLGNADLAVTSVSKAINLGFYSSDLAYCTVFEQNKDAADYFEITKRLSEDLKINVGYSQETVDRFHRNINNSDSLYAISSENYWKTCDFLEETQHINVLPFIIVGSWVESMHLSIHAIEKAPNNEDSIRNRIALQKEPLANLIEYLYATLVDIKVFKINQDIQRIVKELLDLQSTYDQFGTNPEGVKITKAQFDSISEKVSKIRYEYMRMN